MSLGLLFPLGLAALAALLLPLLVHLVRREEQRPTDFAALRWLTARLKPRAKLRFEDLLLLALRLLLVAAMALLLARPVLYGGTGDAPWLLVAPGADPAAAPSLPENTERRWLAPGFHARHAAATNHGFHFQPAAPARCRSARGHAGDGAGAGGDHRRRRTAAAGAHRGLARRTAGRHARTHPARQCGKLHVCRAPHA
ncbi:BatA domain-containing protein [Arenimonas daejeonensis]|uniref:BatA domain-containing protein n=1 Tax=Arenimonas daejeonensis TaxID=370777 RepID=UPI0011BE3E6C|nr:BatA domain-containing protein [Arenimonas daejeonensis]